MVVDGVAAAQWLLNFGAVRPSMCLYYVWQAYKAQGASTSLGAQTAYEAWGMSDGQRPGDRNPPAGAAVWWGRRTWDGNIDGDVVISLGGGRVAVTEAPGMGSVTGSCTLDERESEISREYLGWTSSIFDCPINVDAGKDAAPTPTPAIPSEEDDMLMLSVDFGAPLGTHLCAIGPGVFRHFMPADNPERIKNLIRVDDQWQTIVGSELPIMLRTFGCDLSIWDFRDGGKFMVLDPTDNSVKQGNVWTSTAARYRDIMNQLGGKVDKVELVSEQTAAYLKELTAPKA